MFTNPTLTTIADAHGKSVGQVVLRWLIQRDAIVIPKSVRPERMREDIDIFDFELTIEQIELITALDTNTSLFFDHRDPAIARDFAKRHIDVLNAPAVSSAQRRSNRPGDGGIRPAVDIGCK